MANQSWAFYQQIESGPGIPYPLWWICGLSSSIGSIGFTSQLLTPNVMYAIPFDQLRNMTVDKMIIAQRNPANANGKCRLGIYQNASSANNVPGARVVDAGELALDGANGLKIRSGLNTNLNADTRYWAVILTNADVGGGVGVITGMGVAGSPVIFWGASPHSSNQNFVAHTGLRLTDQTYGLLPANFPAVTAANLFGENVPAIALAFRGPGGSSSSSG